ncbi:MAG: NAD-dependent epimerase/dehydratase family protein [Chloroflexi bacterium]|nr:NAD-dependent epimerase/dehydratase family protein [Chloroflexota bacterium]
MKALVTGATGFIGSNVVRELLAAGHEVRVLVRPGADTRNIDGLPVETAIGDLLDIESLRRAAQGCDALFHVAALYSLWAPNAQVVYRANVEGTVNVLTAALEAGVQKAVYTSSVATISPSRNGRPSAEDAPFYEEDLIGAYKQSKYVAEQEALRFTDKGLPVVVVNPSAPVGRGDIKPTPTGRIVLDFLRGRMPGYVDTGLNVVDVEDVAKGHLLAYEKGKVGQRYILGNSNLSLKEILVTLAQVAGRKAPVLKIPYWAALATAYGDEFVTGRIRGKEPQISVDRVRLSRKHMYYDAGKAVRELGLPQTPVEEAFAKAVAWFRDNGYVR